MNSLFTQLKQPSWVNRGESNVLISAGEKIVTFWNYDSGKVIHSTEDNQNVSLQALENVFSLHLADKSTLILSSLDQMVSFLSLKSGKLLKQFPSDETSNSDDAFSTSVTSMVFIERAKLICTCSHGKDHEVRVFTMKGKVVKRLKHSSCVTKLANYRDTKIISAQDNGTICMWNLKLGTCEKRFEGHKDSVLALDVSCSDVSDFFVSGKKNYHFFFFFFDLFLI